MTQAGLLLDALVENGLRLLASCVYKVPTERKTDNATKKERQALTTPTDKVTLCRTWQWHLAFDGQLFDW